MEINEITYGLETVIKPGDEIFTYGVVYVQGNMNGVHFSLEIDADKLTPEAEGALEALRSSLEREVEARWRGYEP